MLSRTFLGGTVSGRQHAWHTRTDLDGRRCRCVGGGNLGARRLRIALHEEFCSSVAPFRLGCQDVDIVGDPNYEGLQLSVRADQLELVEIQTNIGVGGDAKPYPGDGDAIDEALWGLLPTFGVRNGSAGPVTVNLLGSDPAATNVLTQHMTCCTAPFKTTSYDGSIDLAGDLDVRFYGWEVRRGGCDPSSTTGSVRKCNLQDEQLTTELGQYIHYGAPFRGLEARPFDPKPITFDSGPNGFVVRPNTIAYVVPNIKDQMLSSQPGGGRWSAHSLFRTGQTDWFFTLLLREIATDVHGLSGS